MARFDRSVACVDDEKVEDVRVGEGRENEKNVAREQAGLHGDEEVQHVGEGEKKCEIGEDGSRRREGGGGERRCLW